MTVTTSTMKELTAAGTPDSIGPYLQGVVSGDRLYVSGQEPVDPETGEVVDGTPAGQTMRTLENVEAILEAGGSSLADTVETAVFLKDVCYYDEVNEVYGEYMSASYPARSAVEVVKLPVDIDVEIEVVAER